MSGPDVQLDMNPRGLFASHNDLSELLALFGFQLRYTKMSGTSRIKEEASNGLTSICKWLENNRVDKFSEFRKGRTISLGSRPSTLIVTVSVQEMC